MTIKGLMPNQDQCGQRRPPGRDAPGTPALRPRGEQIDAVVLAEIQANLKYQALKSRRSRFGWSLTLVMLLAYFGYIGLIAFDKAFLAAPIGPGVTSLGIPVGIGLILLTVLLTSIYVWRANDEYDRLTREILEEAGL